MSELSNKTKILKVAADLFSRKGYNGVSINDICQESGITKPTLYYYFKSKRDLYEKLLKEAKKLFVSYVKLALREDFSFIERYEKLLIEILRFIDENPSYIRFIFRMVFSKFLEDMMCDEKDYKKFRFYNNLLTDLKVAQKNGEIRHDLDPEVLAIFFAGSFDFIMIHKVLNSGIVKDNEEITKKIINFLKPLLTGK